MPRIRPSKPSLPPIKPLKPVKPLPATKSVAPMSKRAIRPPLMKR